MHTITYYSPSYVLFIAIFVLFIETPSQSIKSMLLTLWWVICALNLAWDYRQNRLQQLVCRSLPQRDPSALRFNIFTPDPSSLANLS